MPKPPRAQIMTCEHTAVTSCTYVEDFDAAEFEAASARSVNTYDSVAAYLEEELCVDDLDAVEAPLPAPIEARWSDNTWTPPSTPPITPPLGPTAWQRNNMLSRHPSDQLHEDSSGNPTDGMSSSPKPRAARPLWTPEGRRPPPADDNARPLWTPEGKRPPREKRDTSVLDTVDDIVNFRWLARARWRAARS